MNRNAPWRALCMAMAMLLCGSALAQRDPTRAPEIDATARMSGAPKSKAAPDLGDLGLTLLVREGTPYLASGTRLYAVGQTVGAYKIERIAESEIWLRNGKELHKIPRFNGIERRAAATERPTP